MRSRTHPIHWALTPEHSRASWSPASGLPELDDLVVQRTTEAVLVAQDTTRYGEDIGAGRDGLLRLLEALLAATSLPWIRFLYAYPATLDERLFSLMRAEPRYRWLGELDHAGAMRWLARSHVMVISSRMEGGAHVVSEAIGIGVPVIASAISGNIGLLGEDYPGYYPFANETALAAQLARAHSDPAWLTAL